MPKDKNSGLSEQTNEERKEEKRLIELEGKDYHGFDDLPIKGYEGGSSEYYGDGSEQVEFFNNNSNYNEIIKGMSYEERKAFDKYWTVGYFMYGQQWGGWKESV